jgi:hypothetical protein
MVVVAKQKARVKSVLTPIQPLEGWILPVFDLLPPKQKLVEQGYCQRLVLMIG